MAFCRASYAQQDPAFVHYWEIKPQWNPAAAGRSDQLSVNAIYQVHALGYDDAGGTMYAGADMAFQLGKTRHGVGLIFQNDEFGLFSNKRFSVQYSYHFKLFGGRMSIGVEGDMVQESIEGSKADLADSGDPAFPSTDVDGSRFDLSAGIYYNHREKWWAGLSVLHATAPEILVGDVYKYEVKRLYNFSAGYNIKLKSPFFKVVPSTMLRYDGADFRADITGRVIYQRENKLLYAGASWSPQHSATLFVGGSFHGIQIGYAYEANTSGLGLEAGNHEIILSYRMPIDLQKHGKNVHKSVRWL